MSQKYVARSRGLANGGSRQAQKENQKLGVRLSGLNDASHRTLSEASIPIPVLQEVVDDVSSLTGAPGIMLEPRASAGSQAAQPLLEDGSAYGQNRATFPDLARLNS